MEPQNNNPYEFILDPKTNNKKGISFLKDPFMRKLSIVAFIAIVLLIAVVIGSTLFNSSGGFQDLRVIVAQQSEMNRIANLGLEKSISPEARQLAATTKAVIGTDLAETSAYLERVGSTVTPELLSARSNEKTSERLSSAEKVGNFDQEFLDVMEQLFAAYKQDIQASLNAGGGPNKQILVDRMAKNVLIISPNKQ